jgi:opacity protein-like surface antigen
MQPRHGAVRPYVDGLIGFKYLYTNTTIEIDTENSPSDTNLSDVTLSYGVGGGVQVQLTSSRRRPVVLLDAGVRYLRGGRAEYLREGSIQREDGVVFFDVLRSRTDVVTAQVGVTFRF